MEDSDRLFSLEGKVSLVTGGGRGLGLGMARALAGAGSDVVLVSRTEGELSEAARALSQETGRRALAIAADLSRLEELDRVVGMTLDEFQKIHILVNNAGINVRKPFFEVTPEEFERVVSVNLRAVYFLTQKVAQHMVQRGEGGKIIHTASLSAQMGIPNISIYGTTKGGVYALTKQLAVELAPYRILVNAIAPGYFRTSMTEAVFQDPQRSAWVASRTPLGRPGVPSDLGGVAVFLASAASDYLTGSVLYVDGGWMSA